MIAEAVRRGKIRVQDGHRMRELSASHPEMFRQLLTGRVEDGGLMEGLYPTGDAATASVQDYPSDFLSPGERARVEAATGNTPTPEPPVSVAPPSLAPYAAEAEAVTPPAPTAPPAPVAQATPPHAPAPVAASDQPYPAGWLKPQERRRVDSVKTGTYRPPAIQTDDSVSLEGVSE